MPDSAASLSLRRKRARGVYFASAPAGMVRLQAIDSHGNEFMQITVAASAFDDAMARRMRALLDQHDPVRRLILIAPRPR